MLGLVLSSLLLAPPVADPLEAAIGAKNWPQVEALARQRIDHGSRSGQADRLEVLTALGVALNEQGRFAEAEDAYRRALTAARAIRPADRAAILAAEENIAVELQNQARYAEAERAYAAILTARRMMPGSDALMATTLNRLAATIGAQGRRAEAEPLLREALALRLKALGEGDALVAQSYNTLAINLEQAGRFAEAEPLYRRALAIRRTLFGDADASVATTLSNLALNLQHQGNEEKLAEAGPFYVEALRIGRKVWGDNSPYTATIFNNVGNYLEQYGQYAQAETLYKFAYDIRVATLGPNHPDTLLVMNNLAFNADQQGRMADAIALYRAVLKARERQLGEHHPDLVVSRNNLAMLLARAQPTRDEALALARRAVALARELTARERSGYAAGGGAGAQATTRAVSADTTGANPRRYAFELLIGTVWARARDPYADARRLADEAFVTAQDLDKSAAGRAMALTAARVAAGDGPLAKLVQRQQGLSRRAAELDGEIVRKLSVAKAEELAQLREEADTLGLALAEIDAQLQQDFPRYRDIVAPTAIDAEEVTRRLRSDEGLLLIVPSGTDLYSFGLSDAGLAWNRWEGGVAKAAVLVDRLRCQADPLTCAAKDRAIVGDDQALPYDRAGAFELYRALVEPVETVLRGKAKLFVTLSGDLADLPMQLLLAGSSAANSELSTAPWLGERYAILTLPSVAALRLSRERTAPAGSTPFSGFGDPRFAGFDAMLRRFVAAPAAAGAGGANLAARSAALQHLAPLPGTKVELMAMAGVLGAVEGSVHTGEGATETALRADPTVASVRVLAFATHGLLPREIEGVAEPGLVLTPPEVATADDDGVLTASDASMLKLSADWVILSACNTASTQGGGGDSLSSLARGFLYAGAGALLASHWRVSDEVTAVLTVETLREAHEDPAASRALALMRAERAVRTGMRADGSKIPGWTPDWAHPSAWAPFSLISDGD